MADEPLLTPADFAAGTGGKVSASDPRVAPLLSGASVAVRRYCGWHITPPRAETMVLDGPGGSVLLVPTLNLLSVTALTERDEVVDVADLEWSAKGMVRKSGGCWTDRYRGVEITVTHGYDDAPDLVQIVQQVVANALASPMGATREQAGALSVQWATTAPGVSGGLSLLQRDMAVLDSYRLPKGA